MKEFKDNVPGKDFVERFIQRTTLYPESPRCWFSREYQVGTAAVGVNTIRKFFDNIKDVLADADPRLCIQL